FFFTIAYSYTHSFFYFTLNRSPCPVTIPSDNENTILPSVIARSGATWQSPPLIKVELAKTVSREWGKNVELWNCGIVELERTGRIEK
ncbi:MAG: hypothetical protein NTX88_00665, partial [Candidatus Atribacteria bacterium]|nr:hypothetical protein [Candidatus Atribacteria bacterium]